MTRGTRDSITGERKVYWVRCDAALLDLRTRAAEYPGLVHPTSYRFTQQIGARLHRESHPGFVTPSATYRLTREGVAVEREAGQTWMMLA